MDEGREGRGQGAGDKAFPSEEISASPYQRVFNPEVCCCSEVSSNDCFYVSLLVHIVGVPLCTGEKVVDLKDKRGRRGGAVT